MRSGREVMDESVKCKRKREVESALKSLQSDYDQVNHTNEGRGEMRENKLLLQRRKEATGAVASGGGRKTVLYRVINNLSKLTNRTKANQDQRVFS